MLTAQSKPALKEQVDFKRVWQVGLISAAVAAVANGLIFIIGDALGAFPATLVIPNANQPLTLVPVILISVFAALAGTGVFALLARFTRRPVRLFRFIALGVFLLMLVPPFSVPGAGGLFVALLLAMHVVEAGVVTWLLTTRTLKNR